MLSRLRPDSPKSPKMSVPMALASNNSQFIVNETKKRKICGDENASAAVSEDTHSDFQDNLPSLPDVPLKQIYGHLCIADQLRLGSTNSRMLTLMKHVLLTHKSLTILLGNDPLDLIWKAEYKLADKLLKEHEVRSSSAASQLHLRQLHEDTVKWLAKSFAHVTELSLALDGISEADADGVMSLLGLLSPTLTTLKVATSSRLPLLIATVNSMKKLETLTVFADHSLNYSNGGEFTIDLPILAQLKKFIFLSDDDPDCLVDTLRQYALPNEGLIARIGCNASFGFEFGDGDNSFLEDARLAAYFKRCHMNVHRSLPENFANLSSLSSINLYIETMQYSFLTYCSLLEALVNLKQLVSFSFCPNLSHFFFERYRRTLPVLPSVKVLAITPVLGYSKRRLHLKHCYPNLELFIVKLDGTREMFTRQEILNNTGI